MASIFDYLGPKTTGSLTLLAGYIALCRGLRYLRRDRKHAQYPYKTREDMSKMTAEHAFEITKYVMNLEFPFTTEKALQFALFRTYGIPTISTLLCSTQQLSTAEYAPRRYADTSILITEFLSHSPSSIRSNSAIARMNFLHGMHQKSGKISNDDLLYTLSLFVLEVERWIGTYEWRAMTDMEICALGTLWKSIGDAMGISFSGLDHGPDRFKDGLQFVEDLRVWSSAYEARTMVPDAMNHKLAEETIAILLCNAPAFLKPAGKQVVISLMDNRLRNSMEYDDPPSIYPLLTSLLLTARKLVLRYLAPPRPYFLRYQSLSDEADPKTGRYYQTKYESEPWYVKPTFFTKLSPTTLLRRALGHPYPDGKNFKPEGYDILELGPRKLEKSGRKECEGTKERLMGLKRGGCPFAI